MKNTTVTLIVEKNLNEHNQNLWTVIEDGVVLFPTHDPVYAPQALLNRTTR